MIHKKESPLIFILGIIPVLYIALLVAPITNGGLSNIIKNFSSVMEQPFNITWFYII